MLSTAGRRHQHPNNKIPVAHNAEIEARISDKDSERTEKNLVLFSFLAVDSSPT